MSDDLTDMILSGLRADALDKEMGLRIEACLEELAEREMRQAPIYAPDTDPETQKFIEAFMTDPGSIDVSSSKRAPNLKVYVNKGPISKSSSRSGPNLRVVICETNYYQFPSSPYKP